MKTNFRLVATAALLMTLAAVLAGCGSSSSTTPDSGTSNATPMSGSSTTNKAGG